MFPPSLLGRKVHGCVQPPFCHLNTKCLEKIALFFRKIIFFKFFFGFSFHQLQIWRSGFYYFVYLPHRLTYLALAPLRFQCLVSSRSLLWGFVFSSVLKSSKLRSQLPPLAPVPDWGWWREGRESVTSWFYFSQDQPPPLKGGSSVFGMYLLPDSAN